MTILVKTELYVKSRQLIFQYVIFFILCVNRHVGSFRVTLLRSSYTESKPVSSKQSITKYHEFLTANLFWFDILWGNRQSD